MESGRARSIYVVLLNGAQKNRIGALRHFHGEAMQVTYVSRVAYEVEPAAMLVVRPSRNPLAILGLVGLGRLQRALERLVYFPTRNRLWVRSAVRAVGARVRSDIRAGRTVTVLTVAPPHDVPLIGRRLKRRFPEIQWVCDWQDYWTLDRTYLSRTPRIRHRQVRRLERTLFSLPDANVVLNEPARQHVVAHCGADPTRTLPIPHHIADGDLQVAPRRSKGPHPIRIGFAGGMFKGSKVDGEFFLREFGRIRNTLAEPPTLHLHGPIPSTRSRELDAAQGLVQEPYLDTERMVEALADYDYLLLLMADDPIAEIAMHLKIPDYIASRTPIVAVVPASSHPASIIRQTGTGFIVDITEATWADRLAGVLRGEVTGPSRNDDAIERFTWNRIRPLWQSVLAPAGHRSEEGP